MMRGLQVQHPLFMSPAPLGLSAALAYLLATVRLAVPILRQAGPDPGAKPQALLVGALAVVLHAAMLSQLLPSAAGLNLAFFNALSLFAWMIAVIVLVASLGKPLENVALLALPLAAATAVLAVAYPSEHLVSLDRGFGFALHLVLAVVAYALVSVAAVQAVVLAYQDRQLRRKRLAGGLRALPPLQTQETLLFQLIAAGFFVLSLAIVTGAVFVEALFGRGIGHKTVLSVVAWVILGVLLWGRWRYGWRGRVAIRWSLIGFVTLMLAYFGSKFVLELVLGR
jgi:ABC-type uncharacterized transport system permease subunit